MSTMRPPGDDGWPVIGQSLAFARDPFGFYERMGAYGDVVRTNVFGREVYQIRHPEPVRTVLVAEHDRYEKSEIIRENTDEIAPTGLVTLEGEAWERVRGLVQPAFYREQVERYDAAMTTAAERAAAGWTDGDRLDVASEMKGLTLDVLSGAMFGGEIADLEGGRDPVAAATSAINDRLDVSSPSRFLPTWVPTPTNRRFRRAMATLDDAIATLIERRRAREEPGEDLLGMLVAAGGGDGLTDRELRDQLFTFLFAGHETSSMALTYAWLLLATHPERRARLEREVDALDGAPDARAVRDGLPYTEAVVREALRLYPPAFVLFRQPVEDTTLHGYHVPAGTDLSIPIFEIHRDGRWWADTEAFRPARWLVPADASAGEFDDDFVPPADALRAPDDDLRVLADPPGRPEYAYFPFGGGPRACIGNRFAMLELRLAVATLARDWRFDLAPGQAAEPDLRMSVTLQPSEPIELLARRRD
jgi:cytochrome P450